MEKPASVHILSQPSFSLMITAKYEMAVESSSFIQASLACGIDTIGQGVIGNISRAAPIREHSVLKAVGDLLSYFLLPVEASKERLPVILLGERQTLFWWIETSRGWVSPPDHRVGPVEIAAF